MFISWIFPWNYTSTLYSIFVDLSIYHGHQDGGGETSNRSSSTERVIQDQHVHGGYQKYLFKWRGILVF